MDWRTPRLITCGCWRRGWDVEEADDDRRGLRCGPGPDGGDIGGDRIGEPRNCGGEGPFPVPEPAPAFGGGDEEAEETGKGV